MRARDAFAGFPASGMLPHMDMHTRAMARIRRGWAGWLGFWYRRPRWQRGVVWSLLVAYGTYLVLANLLLNTVLEPMANRRPEAFQASWGPAWSWRRAPIRVK